MFQVVASHCELIFCLLTSPKCELGRSRKAMFQGLVLYFQLIFCLLISPKCSLGEVEKATFHVVYDTLNSFSVFTSPKCGLFEVDKATFQVVEYYFELIFCLLGSLKCYLVEVDKAIFPVHFELIFCPFMSPKWNWNQFEKWMYDVVAGHREFIFSLLASLKWELFKVEKKFECLHCILNSFSASWSGQYATWLKSINQWIKFSHGTLNSFLPVVQPKMRFVWGQEIDI